MASKYLKKLSTSSVRRETSLHHQERRDVGKDVGKSHPSYIWWDCQNGAATWKTTWQYIKRVELQPSQEPQFHLWTEYPKEMKTRHAKTCSRMFLALYMTAKIGNIPHVRQLMNEQVICGVSIQWNRILQ